MERTMNEWLKSRLHELSEHGASVWIDSLSREMLRDRRARSA